MDNFWAAIIVIVMLTWYSMFGVFDHNYKVEQQDVENIVHQYTQIAAKKGVLYRSVFEEMSDKLNKYGAYEVYISAEKFEGGSLEPLKLEGFEVVDRDLRGEGYDLINISVVYEKRHPVSVMYEYTVFGTPNGASYDFKLAGKSAVYIQ